MKINQTGAHLDHMLRQTRVHHVQLSAMADSKAGTLMSVSAVMMTLSTPYLGKAEYKAAVAILIIFCLLTILLATYTVAPKLPILRSRKPAPAPEDRHRNFNLLFFGDFANLELEQFKAEMEEVMNDSSKAYEVQVQEVYVLGRYLADQKFRLLRLAYISFITGIFCSASVLLVTHLFQ